MIVSHKHKFIFIRPRKVAGTSVSIALGRSLGSSDVLIFLDSEKQPVAGLDENFPPIRQQNDDAVSYRARHPHVLPQTLRDELDDDVWESYCKFTIVRNPWDWFVSLHVYWARHLWDTIKVRGGLRRRSSTLFRRGRTFRQAQQMLQSGQVKESVELALRRNLYPRQLADVERHCLLNDRRYADCYLRFENLQEDYDGLCQRLGIEQHALPRAKTQLRKGNEQYQHYYTSFSRQRIADYCGRMLDEFGYSFD